MGRLHLLKRKSRLFSLPVLTKIKKHATIAVACYTKGSFLTSKAMDINMKTIRLSDYGILPDSDITASLFSLFKNNSEDTEFVFENAVYYFSPDKAQKEDYRISNSDVMPYRTIAILMKNMKNCILRGNGARLFLSGHMQVFTLDHCDNVKLEGFIVNWKKPLVAEGTVLGVNGGEIDVYIDPRLFPHRYNNNNLEFDIGAGQWHPYNKCAIAFEPHSLRARRGVSDIWVNSILPLGNSVYRLSLWGEPDIHVGDILNMRHNARIHAGIFTEKCSDITVQDVTFHSCGGLGCLSQFCHNMTYRGVHFIPDKNSGRLVSGGRDDGMHITCNSGTVTIDGCTFHALMDDPINVHGCSVTSDEVVDRQTLRCKFRHHQACGFLYWAKQGDEIGFIARDTMEALSSSTALEYILEDSTTFLLKFDSPLPESILDMAKKGGCLALDNLTNTPSFICTNNRFGSCRARGLLVSTPGQIRICNNYFESSGSAILVAGDANGWFESGECHDVLISGNIFTDACLGSVYQFCDGVISICPVVPHPDESKPFHKNIRITDNVFDTVGVPLLYGFSCQGLDFSKNRIFKSPSLPGTAKYNYPIHLSYCQNVTISDNLWTGHFDPLGYSEEHCRNISSDISAATE